MKISSEKNPLPGRYVSYRNPSKEEHAKMLETWSREREEKSDEMSDSERIVEEEPLNLEADESNQVPKNAIGDEEDAGDTESDSSDW